MGHKVSQFNAKVKHDFRTTLRSHQNAMRGTIGGMGRPKTEARRTALRAFMDRAGLKAYPWAVKAKISEGTIRNFLSGITSSLNDATYQALADAAAELLNRPVGVGELRGEPLVHSEVPLVGYVGAGAEIIPFDDHAKGAGFDMVSAPPIGDRNVVAVQVRGDSMYPVYRDGDILFYSRQNDEVGEHLIGQECIVRVEDGRSYLKVLKRGQAKRSWTLASWNAPDIENVKLAWAAPVRWILRSSRRGTAL